MIFRNRQALGLLMSKHVRNRHPAFDGKKNMYAGGTRLPFPQGASVCGFNRNLKQE